MEPNLRNVNKTKLMLAGVICYRMVSLYPKYSYGVNKNAKLELVLTSPS